MNSLRKSVGTVVLGVLLGSMAVAQESVPAAPEPAPVSPEAAPIVRTHDPVLATCAAMIDLVYLPLRLATTAVGGILGGVVGFITLGDKAAAESIWELTDGSQIVTPEMLEGVEPFHWTGYD